MNPIIQAQCTSAETLAPKAFKPDFKVPIEGTYRLVIKSDLTLPKRLSSLGARL